MPAPLVRPPLLRSFLRVASISFSLYVEQTHNYTLRTSHAYHGYNIF